MRFILQCLFSLSFLVSSTVVHAQPVATAQEREALVRKFIDAFNQHDADAMMAMMAPDMQWLGIDGAKIVSEGASREAIGASMRKYFQSCPTCRSRLDGVVASAHRLSAMEVAQWKKGEVRKEQRSLSVYEFAGPLISRVYYFPAER